MRGSRGSSVHVIEGVAVSNEWNPHDIFDILGDERVQAILQLTARRSMSVNELTEELDASDSSIYRRIRVLVDYDILDEHNAVERNGRHYNVYSPNFDHARIDLTEDGLTVAVYDRDGNITDTESATDNDSTDSRPIDGLTHD